jgi:hypothetical protein
VSSAPLRIYRGDRTAALGVLALLGLLASLTFLDVYGPPIMKRIARLAALALLAVPLTGCLGLTPVGRTIVGKLPNYEIRQAPAIPCSEMLVRVDPEARLTNAQQRAVVKVCEDMTRGVIVDPGELQDAMRQTVPGPF